MFSIPEARMETVFKVKDGYAAKGDHSLLEIFASHTKGYIWKILETPIGD